MKIQSEVCAAFVNNGGNPSIFDPCSGGDCPCSGVCSGPDPCCISLSGCSKCSGPFSGDQCIPATGDLGTGTTAAVYFSWAGLPNPPNYDKVWKIDMSVAAVPAGNAVITVESNMTGDMPYGYGGNPTDWFPIYNGHIGGWSSPVIRNMWNLLIGGPKPDVNLFRSFSFMNDSNITSDISSITVTDVYLTLYFILDEMPKMSSIIGGGRSLGSMQSASALGYCCE